MKLRAGSGGKRSIFRPVGLRLLLSRAVPPVSADLHTAAAAVTAMAGPDPRDPRSRDWPCDVALSAPHTPRLAIPNQAKQYFTNSYQDFLNHGGGG